MERIDVVMPARNDGRFIGEALQSIVSQDFSGEFAYDVLVVANGCTDDTVAQAEAKSDAFDNHDLTSLRVISREKANKIAAINMGLLATSRSLVLSVDSDVTFSRTCFDLLAEKMQNPQVKVTGAIPRLRVTDTAKENNASLGEVQTVSELYFAARDHYDGPWGNAMGFKREAVPLFPDNAVVDDTWLGLYASHVYDLSAVEMEPRAEVYGKLPENWRDWLAQRTRWSRNGEAVLRQFPEFRHVLDERAARRKLPYEELDRRTLEAMNRQGIAPERLAQYKFFQKMCNDDAQLIPDIVGENGDWEDLPTS